jgi:hypothetical protein
VDVVPLVVQHTGSGKADRCREGEGEREGGREGEREREGERV